jgi:hypothetical protein
MLKNEKESWLEKTLVTCLFLEICVLILQLKKKLYFWDVKFPVDFGEGCTSREDFGRAWDFAWFLDMKVYTYYIANQLYDFIYRLNHIYIQNCLFI